MNSTILITLDSEYDEDLVQCELDTNSKIDSFEIVIKVFKFLALLMHILFFLSVCLIKEFQTKNSTFLNNMSIDCSIYIDYGMFTFDP